MTEMTEWLAPLGEEDLANHCRFLEVLRAVIERELPDIDPRILGAFEAVRRQLFLPLSLRGSLNPGSLHQPCILSELSSQLAPPILHLLAIRALDVQPAMRCLDVGCGTGFVFPLSSLLSSSLLSSFSFSSSSFVLFFQFRPNNRKSYE